MSSSASATAVAPSSGALSVNMASIFKFGAKTRQRWKVRKSTRSREKFAPRLETELRRSARGTTRRWSEEEADPAEAASSSFPAENGPEMGAEQKQLSGRFTVGSQSIPTHEEKGNFECVPFSRFGPKSIRKSSSGRRKMKWKNFFWALFS